MRISDWSSDVCSSDLFIATHVSIRTSDTSSSPLEPPSQAYRTLSYHARPEGHASAASVYGLAPLHLPRRTTRSVSYYAFFNGWLLLSQPPACLCLPDRKSVVSGKSVSVRVDLGGRRFLNTKL